MLLADIIPLAAVICVTKLDHIAGDTSVYENRVCLGLCYANLASSHIFPSFNLDWTFHSPCAAQSCRANHSHQPCAIDAKAQEQQQERLWKDKYLTTRVDLLSTSAVLCCLCDGH
jgi:hypothetical protein